MDAPHEAAVQEWTRWVVHQASLEQARLLGQLGSTLVFSWDAVDCGRAVDLSLTLISKAEKEYPSLRLGYGVVVGSVLLEPTDDGSLVRCSGSALDLAQATAALAGQAHGVMVDGGAHERLSERYLFGAEQPLGSMAVYPLDLSCPLKMNCRRAVGALRTPPPIPKVRATDFAAARERLLGKAERHLVFRADSPFEAIDWLERIAVEHPPALQLHLRSQAGGLQPLGSLQAALLGPPQGGGLDVHLGTLEDSARQTLEAIMAGKAVEREPAVHALSALLDRGSSAALLDRAPSPAWVVLHRLHDVDAATLGVLAESKARLQHQPIVVCCTPHDASVPEVLFPPSDLFEIVLGELPLDDLQASSAALLGLESGSPLAVRVAQLAEPIPQGVLEACRTLVTSGDLLPTTANDGDGTATQGGFRWRTAPREGNASIPIEALIAERVAGAPALAYRMLEVLVVTANSASLERILQIAARDGLTAAEAHEGLQRLQEETFLDAQLSFGAYESAVRMAVRNTMPPARSAELHRFAAQVLQEERGTESQGAPAFEMALLAYHRAEGGLVGPAAQVLLDAAESAFSCGFQRMAVRLAASAVQLDQAAEHRDRARRLMKQVDRSQDTPQLVSEAESSTTSQRSEEPRTPGPREDDDTALGQRLARKAIAEAVRAIRSRDLETVERHLDAAVAAGSGPGAVRRIHAMALLARQDLEGATLTLQQPARPGAPPGERARQLLSWSLVLLEGGQPEQAVRTALAALHLSRQQQDTRGIRATLLVLSGCYTALGDSQSASRLAKAAEPESQPETSQPVPQAEPG